MESFFGNKFDKTCRKIRYVLTDSCNAASKSSKLLAAKLETIALFGSPRKSPRKYLHTSLISWKNAFVKLSLITSGLFLWLHQKTCSKFLKAKWTRQHAYKLCFMASTKLSKISLLYRRTILLSWSKCIDCTAYNGKIRHLGSVVRAPLTLSPRWNRKRSRYRF